MGDRGSRMGSAGGMAGTTGGARRPNVVFVVLDDVGFAQFGCYGSDIPTPTFDALAAGGLRYANFHVSPMCSPTRASLLTGRNHHAVGLGAVAEFATTAPGYTGRLSRRAATLAEMLRPHGYNSVALGKWHLMPLREATAAGPFDAWPLQRGFDRWYGFPSGFADQWHPELFEDNHSVPIPSRPGYHLSEDLVDRAIANLRDQQAASPGKPFFLYLALGAAHWPHQAPREYIERHRGRYDRGWDVAREEVLARQVAMGIMPPGTTLPPRNDDAPAWDDLTPDERRLAARHMEAYAGFLEHADAQVGRLVGWLRSHDMFDDTLVVLLSDNGASNEGDRLGCVNVAKAFTAQIPEPIEVGLEAINRLGDDTTNPHYPTGWAQAGNTPFRLYKRHAHGGGVRAPLVMHWPRRIAARGEIRHQFHHVTDIVPTILEELGIAAPATVEGVPQMPVHGASLAYTFDDASGATRRGPQYFEMLGNRALWDGGWKAVARHETGSPFADDVWELYDLDADPTEANDLAAVHPARLRDLVERWWAEAGRYDVLPMDDRDFSFLRNPRRPGGRLRFTYHPSMARVERHAAPPIADRSHAIVATVDVPEGGASGVILSAGSRFGGYVLYMEDGRLAYEYNFGEVRYRAIGEAPVGAGRRSLAWRFARTGARQGTGTLVVDGASVAMVDLPDTWPYAVAQAGVHCGRDEGSTVSARYAAPFAFSGTIDRVVVVVADGPDGIVPDVVV